MITYELAKQLKDAGFIQNISLNAEGIMNNSELAEGDVVYFPTLSELIEACGDNFSSLINQRRFIKDNTIIKHIKENTPDLFWMCCGNNKVGEVISSTSSTPEEAVAKLWIELNKK